MRKTVRIIEELAETVHDPDQLDDALWHRWSLWVDIRRPRMKSVVQAPCWRGDKPDDRATHVS